MYRMYRSLLAVLATLAVARAVDIDVDVGENGLVFDPDSFTAQVGDRVVFHFYPGDHSVASGPFASPCQPGPNSFFSGFLPGVSDGSSAFAVTVTSTDPVWFYCSQVGHCNAGMVGVMNPSGGQTVDDYKAAAAKAGPAKDPGSVQGGSLITDSDDESSSSAPAEPTTTTAAPTTAAGETASTTAVSTSSTPTTAAPTTVATTAASASSSASASTSAPASPSKSTASAATVGSSAPSKSSKSGGSTPSAAPTTPTTVTTNTGGRTSDMTTALGLAVIVGVLAALMA